MRKAVIYVSILPIILILGFILVMCQAPTAPVYSLPTATPMADAAMPTALLSAAPVPSYSLPLCTNEDGSGQALCMWDAAHQGDGEGMDVIAGDCSVGTVYSQDASDVCMAVWYGSPDGPEIVEECLTIAWQIEVGEVERQDGWTVRECFDGMVD